MSTSLPPTGHAQPALLSPSLRAKLFWLGAALVVAALVMAGAASYHRSAPAAAAQPPGIALGAGSVQLSADAPQWSVLQIAPAQASREQWSEPVPGYVRVNQSIAASVSSPLQGRVTRVFVELGQEVNAGDPLFAVASPELADLQQDVSRSAVELDTARHALERVNAMVEARVMPAKEGLAASKALRQAELAHNAASSRLSALKISAKSSNEFTVKSPRAGRIVEKRVLPSQEVARGGETLMMVADLSSVWVMAELFESDAVGLKAGAPARISVAALPEEVFEGTVEMVSAVVDPDRNSVPVRVHLDNRDGRLKPNTYARLQFQSAPPPGSVEVASSAVLSDGASKLVYVREGAELRRRPVTARSSRQGKVVVTSGLTAGELVVERGGLLLDNAVRIAE
jgi:RND family efflux transporter MFP subunit